MEDVADKGEKFLKESSALQWLLQIYSHVLPVSQLRKTVVGKVVGKKKTRKFLVLVFLE